MFSFDKSTDVPLYQQLYEQLRLQITDGVLSKGEKLPPTRGLAAEYRLSRNTVIQAYQQLEVEGYVRSVIGSGYYVEDLHLFQNPYHNRQPAQPPFPKAEKQDNLFDFYYGNLDYNCYRSRAWRTCLLDAYDRLAAQEAVSYNEPQGLWELRCALARYLHLSRGVCCSAEQILLTNGHQQSLSLLARLFSDGNWNFAMENPGYNGTRTILQQNGFLPIPVPLEQDGISIAAVQKLTHSLLYITPSHQFPMGSVLPITKRLALLQWAAESGSYILEDDYDSELRYHSLPIPSLQSVDSCDRTIYMGTFSKSLSPDLRVAYLVLPRRLLGSYHAISTCSNCTVPSLLQYALEQFIRNGEYQKHTNMMRTYYRKKHDYIREYVKENLSGKAKLIGEDSGLHFILEVVSSLPQEKLVREFSRKKIRIYKTVPFWQDPADAPNNQLLFGFSSIPLEQLPKAMTQLTEVLQKI